MSGDRPGRAGRAVLRLGLVTCLVTGSLLGPLAGGASAAAAPYRTTFVARSARTRACFDARTSGRGVDGFAVRAHVTGVARVRLAPVDAAASSADWDVAVFDEGSGALLGASAGPRSDEVADAHVTAGQRLWVQGCRYAGRAARVDVSVTVVATPTPSGSGSGTDQLVRVVAPTPAARRTLAALDLDPADDQAASSAGPAVARVVLHGVADADRLRRAGLVYSVEVPDLAADAARARRADAAYAASTARSDLPSGRTTYRHLWDYDYELKELARLHPDLVRTVVLPGRSYEGRDISGVEIARHVAASDGRPVFLDAGLIHAREWPAGELPMEWAYDLVHSYGHDATLTRLVRAARTIVVPVVNPDGFSVSREAVPGAEPGTGYDYQRKNCDPAGAPSSDGLRTGICPASPAGTARGTDLNRNFGAFWGGAGASTDWSDETYRGTGPFSAPEARALRGLISTRQVTNLIMNHTAAGVVLRPPGLVSEGTPVDEPLLVRLGQRLADHDGYPSIPVYGLTDATGGSDEWAYWVGGSLAYTVEIGTPGFHPTFADVVAEYLGRAPAAGAGKGGNRGTYLTMLAATARTADHAEITGRAPRGWTLGLRKTFRTPTSPVVRADGSVGSPRQVRDTFTSRLQAPGGRFRWGVNPSTRPYVAGRYGREPLAPPQAPTVLVNPPGDAPPGDDQGTNGPHEEATFTVQAPPQADDGTATVKLSWSNPDTFWYADVERPDGGFVAQTYAFDATSETMTLHDPEPGTYVVKIVNGGQVEGAPFDDWSGQVTYASPTPAVPGVTEPWTLTCRRPDGSVAGTREVVVRRGQSVDVGRVCTR